MLMMPSCLTLLAITVLNFRSILIQLSLLLAAINYLLPQLNATASDLAIKHKDSIAFDDEYFIGDNKNLRSAFVKNFCVLISSHLKRSCHILQIVSAASICSYHILESFLSKNLLTLQKLIGILHKFILNKD